MNARRWAAAGLVPLIVLLAGASLYELSLWQDTYLLTHGMPVAPRRQALDLLSVVHIAGLFAGGVVAALIGPFAAASVGLATFGTILLILAFAPIASWHLAWALLALATAGGAVAVPGCWAGVASAFPRPRQGARDALFFLLFGATVMADELGGCVSASVVPEFDIEVTGHHRIFSALAATALAGAVLAAGLVARGPATDEDASGRFEPRAAGLAAALALATLVPWLGYEVATEVWAVPFSVSANIPGWTGPLADPIGLVFATALGAALCAVTAWLGVAWPALLGVGAGFLAAAASVAWLGTAGSVSGGAYAVGTVVLVSVEAVITPLLLSRILGDLHWRVAALYAGTWLAVIPLAAYAMSAAAKAVTTAAGLGQPPAAGAALCAIGGLLVLAIAVPHERLSREIIESAARD